MSNDIQKPKRGRPKKEVPPSPGNVSDASLSRLDLYMRAIAEVASETPILAGWFREAEPSAREAVLRDLAVELAFYPAMVNAANATIKGRTGPKPKTAQMFLLTEVRATLAAVGVSLPQWKNGRGQRTDLADFCSKLIEISGDQGRHISIRTSDTAPEIGWKPLP